MVYFLIFLLGGIGITSIIVDSEFFRETKEKFAEKIKIRTDNVKTKIMQKINYMLNCYQCSGFWVGFWLGLLMRPCHMPCVFLEMIICGGVISFSSQIGMAMFNFFNVQR